MSCIVKPYEAFIDAEAQLLVAVEQLKEQFLASPEHALRALQDLPDDEAMCTAVFRIQWWEPVFDLCLRNIFTGIYHSSCRDERGVAQSAWFKDREEDIICAHEEYGSAGDDRFVKRRLDDAIEPIIYEVLQGGPRLLAAIVWITELIDKYVNCNPPRPFVTASLAPQFFCHDLLEQHLPTVFYRLIQLQSNTRSTDS